VKTTEKVTNISNGNINGISAAMARAQAMTPLSAEYFAHRPEHNGSPNPVAGILMQRRQIRYKDGREGWQFIVALTAEAWLWDDNGEPFLAVAGVYALVPERAGLLELHGYLPAGDQVVEVLIEPLRKVPLGGGKTMWKFHVRGRRLNRSESPVQLMLAANETAQTSGADDDVIPF